jgi:hypothetical protein
MRVLYINKLKKTKLKRDYFKVGLEVTIKMNPSQKNIFKHLFCKFYLKKINKQKKRSKYMEIKVLT